jgi:uncharacterized membrane protein
MSEHSAPALRSALPFAEQVRVVGSEQPFRWLAAGWRDSRAAGLVSLMHGLIFVLAGFALTYGLVAVGLTYLIAPLIAGFMLVGPALTVGFYAISRELEAGHAPRAADALGAWKANKAPLLGLGLMLVMFLVVWMRFAALIFAIFFPFAPLDVQALLNAALFTRDGITFLIVGSIVGAGMAGIAFTLGAFSLPLLLDRRVGLLQALVISAVAVVVNARTMAVWTALIVVFTAAGLACAYVGLAVTLPLVGHATWYAYRAVIRPEADQA